MREKQKTIRKEVLFEGIGIHSGLKSHVTLKPLPENTGIIIRNIQFPHEEIQVGEVIPEKAMYATVIKRKSWQVSTIEHVMATIGALGIDNVLIEIDGVEIPIMDGSASQFVSKVLEIGIEEQMEAKKYITPKEVVTFIDETDDRSITITPAQKKQKSVQDCIDRDLNITYRADFPHPLVGAGSIKCSLSTSFFVEEIAPARTFGFLNQLPFMRKHGLARGASLENTVVIGEAGFLNKPRFKDEFIRHKLLDFIGDLALLGKKLIGTVAAKRTGHCFNRLVVEHYIKHPDKWEVI